MKNRTRPLAISDGDIDSISPKPKLIVLQTYLLSDCSVNSKAAIKISKPQ